MDTSKQVILGTAGHIDHGKTSLVKALTGVDTDRLKEEKERGITIELGFACLDLPSGLRLGIIDVPGHEKFVKHMVAGAWGIDVVALIIAADEGVMPQTREHLDICTLLKVKKGLVVLTKSDLVDRELLELVTEEVTDFVQNSFLSDAPILHVSSITGEGIPDLIMTMDRLASEVEERSADGLFRLPIDRVFVMKGFGTVVTGTLISGSVSAGETIQILPLGLEGKVRNLQVHNSVVERATAGQRTAVNLQGVESTSIARGEVLVRPQTLTPTRVIDAYLEYLPSAPRPLKHRVNLRFHIGTSMTTASIFLLDGEELAPGEGGFVQVRLDRPVVAMSQDRFVIRGSSAIQTMGGGIVLDTHPTKHKRFASSVLNRLRLFKDGTAEEVLNQHILQTGVGGVGLVDLLGRVAISPKEAHALLSKMIARGDLLLIDSERMKVIHRDHYGQLRERVLVHLKEFHQRFPMRSGLAKEELRTKLPMELDVRLFQIVVNALIQTGEMVLEKDKLRLKNHRVSSTDEKGLIKRIEKTLLEGGLQPFSPKELAERWSEREEEIRAAFEHLAHEGVLIKIRSGMFFHRVPIDRLREGLIAFLKVHREITTPQFKEMTGVSRKFAIPLIEYFDQKKLTIRLGDKRILRASSSAPPASSES